MLKKQKKKKIEVVLDLVELSSVSLGTGPGKRGRTFIHATYNMPKICQRYAQDIPEICQRYAKDMTTICQRYVNDMVNQYIAKFILKICQIYAKCMPNICQRYAKYMPKKCQIYVNNMFMDILTPKFLF